MQFAAPVQAVSAAMLQEEDAPMAPCASRQVSQAELAVMPFAIMLVHAAVHSLAQGEPVTQPQLVIWRASNCLNAAALFVSHAISQAALALPPPVPLAPPVPVAVLPPVPVPLLEVVLVEVVEVEVVDVVLVLVLVVLVEPPVPPELLELHAMARPTDERSATSLIEVRTMDESFRHAEG